MKTWIAFWNILKKDIQNYYLKPPNISWGLFFPLSWTLMQMFRSAGSEFSEIRSMLPGLMSMSVLFGTTSMLASPSPLSGERAPFERLLWLRFHWLSWWLLSCPVPSCLGYSTPFVPVVLAAFFVDLAGLTGVQCCWQYF